MKDEELTKFAVNLIRAHCESKDDKFTEECRKVAKYFDENKEWQLAEYVRVLIGDCKDVWVPM